jgi:hypothetical protein
LNLARSFLLVDLDGDLALTGFSDGDAIVTEVIGRSLNYRPTRRFDCDLGLFNRPGAFLDRAINFPGPTWSCQAQQREENEGNRLHST